jgi:hypothetical protein
MSRMHSIFDIATCVLWGLHQPNRDPRREAFSIGSHTLTLGDPASQHPGSRLRDCRGSGSFPVGSLVSTRRARRGW